MASIKAASPRVPNPFHIKDKVPLRTERIKKKLF